MTAVVLRGAGEILLIYIVRNVTFTEIAYFCKACYCEPKAALEMLTSYSFVCIPVTKYSYQVQWKSPGSEIAVGLGRTLTA